MSGEGSWKGYHCRSKQHLEGKLGSLVYAIGPECSHRGAGARQGLQGMVVAATKRALLKPWLVGSNGNGSNRVTAPSVQIGRWLLEEYSCSQQAWQPSSQLPGASSREGVGEEGLPKHDPPMRQDGWRCACRGHSVLSRRG